MASSPRSAPLSTWVAALQNHSPSVRYQAVVAISSFGLSASSAIPSLQLLLTDPDRAVRTAAAETLAAIASRPTSADFLVDANGNVSDVRFGVARPDYMKHDHLPTDFTVAQNQHNSPGHVRKVAPARRDLGFWWRIALFCGLLAPFVIWAHFGYMSQLFTGLLVSFYGGWVAVYYYFLFDPKMNARENNSVKVPAPPEAPPSDATDASIKLAGIFMREFLGANEYFACAIGLIMFFAGLFYAFH